MFKGSLVRKLVFYFLVINIITLVIVGLYSYTRAKDALVERTFDQLTSVRIEKEYRIEKLFSDRIFDLKLVSNSEDVRDIIDLLREGTVSGRMNASAVYSEYDRFLRKHFFSGRYYKRFFIVSSGGSVVSFNIPGELSPMKFDSVRYLPVNSMWTKIITDPESQIEDFKPDSGNYVPAIFIGAPVKDSSGSVIGAAIAQIDIDAVNSIMFEVNPRNGLGKTGESYLVGSDLLMRSTSRFQDNSVFRTTVDTKGVREALAGITGTSVIKDYRNIPVLSSYSGVDIPGLHWAILAEIDEEEAMIPIYSIRNNILFLGSLLTLLLFAVVYLIAKRISLPVIRLKDAALKITGGNYDVMVEDSNTNDEVESLVTAFNEMSARIKKQTETLMMERSMRLSSMIDGQELERLRLSRELHDGLAQSILAIKLRLEKASNAPREKAIIIMHEVEQQFANVIEEIRRISNDLMPAELSQFGLSDALSNLCREVSASSGIKVEFKPMDFKEIAVDRINTYLYRITQEALNNIVKHSNAVSAVVKLESGEMLFLEISDNGKGFDYKSDARLCGNGISNIKERVALLNGGVEIISKREMGTKIKISIPLNR
jgi:signal transduction histidine kinase